MSIYVSSKNTHKTLSIISSILPNCSKLSKGSSSSQLTRVRVIKNKTTNSCQDYKSNKKHESLESHCNNLLQADKCLIIFSCLPYWRWVLIGLLCLALRSAESCWMGQLATLFICSHVAIAAEVVEHKPFC